MGEFVCLFWGDKSTEIAQPSFNVFCKDFVEVGTYM